ncbi:Na+/melibiose symporter-like transporter [Neobacillus niacini]|nr:Na+/melibiose symporter-like transporter [Neobacillus niacini]
MSFKKAFIIGYIVFLIALAFVYFFVPHEYNWIAIVILCLLFGIYQVIVGYRLKQT